MKISIIGAGNMAHHLGKALLDSDHNIVQVYNRSYKKGKNIAQRLRATCVKSIDELNLDIDLIIIAVSDDAIGSVAESLNAQSLDRVLVVHTSGSVPSTVLKEHASYGVFYPFQSLTMGHEIDFREIPILIDSNSARSSATLEKLGRTISDHVHEVSDDQRGDIHIAGVFANNFGNHMIALSKEILDSKSLSFNILKPLIANTLQKLLKMDPIEAQTGPAVRGDSAVLYQHLEKLSGQPDLQEIYKMLTKSIIDLHDSKRQHN